jgi:broad specificity phosphatase PhoE
MARKKIYLVRHGQTEYNIKGIVQGSSIDSDLNEMGNRQADAFFDAYQDVDFDRIVTSKLKRTHQSVRKFIEKDIQWNEHAGFNEISWGVFDGQKIHDDHAYWGVLKQWNNGEVDLKIESGESPEDVAKRQKIAWKQIIDSDKDETILLCMHGRAMRILLTHLSNRPLHEMDKFGHENLGLYILESNDGKVSLTTGNLTEHLKEI